MRFIEILRISTGQNKTADRPRGEGPRRGREVYLARYWLLEKSRPRALFSERRLRSRRQKAWFFPPALTRSYALAGRSANLCRPMMLVGRITLLGQEALADAGGR